MTEIFFRILRMAVGSEPMNEVHLPAASWAACFEFAKKHSLVGVLFPIAQRYMKDEDGKRFEPLFHQWLGATWQIQERNRLMNERVVMLKKRLETWGVKSCLLKGQGVARLYKEPELRQSGDIDMWIDARQDEFLQRVKDEGIKIENIDYVHSNIKFFEDTEVEIHFRPSWMYNPFDNHRLQNFFKKHKQEQFDHLDSEVNFAYPTVAFNLVYSMIHINRHIFEEGIGLRQLMDYYFILLHSKEEERKEAFDTLKDLHLDRFAAAVMFVITEVFKIDSSMLLCKPDESEGRFLLDEILIGGNFGKFDKRNEWFEKGQRWKRGWFNAKRNIRYLKRYPSEVICIPAWKLCHFVWRKRKGYL